ncbi:ribulose-phosphate 3-epimerase [Streptococcus orisasini]|uniref:ribulose-phosphate 3-epimerase n=1 Tax=Streptococcus orisasini TaxID=1080071 RepID=UPI00070F1F2A|nr:ribulose-phosphate 3-epimerase [Streptococcus orisasini]
MAKLLCPSIMCADFGKLRQEVRELDQAGVDIFHCDVMDGSFVPNMAMGMMAIETVRRNTDKMVDCHLMIENPSSKIDWFIDAGADLIYIHPESERYVSKTLAYIKSRGKLAGLAVNPDTAPMAVAEVLHLCDYLLIMTVNPGFAGQQFLVTVKEKIKMFLEMKKKYHYKVIIDGACSPQIIAELSKMGCDGFVLGTSALFGKEKTYHELIKELRKL